MNYRIYKGVCQSKQVLGIYCPGLSIVRDQCAACNRYKPSLRTLPSSGTVYIDKEPRRFIRVAGIQDEL